MSTLLEALNLETDIKSYNTCSSQSILRDQEKALRSINDHLKHVDLAADIPQHLHNCCSFCRKATDLSTLLPAELKYGQIINHLSI